MCSSSSRTAGSVTADILVPEPRLDRRRRPGRAPRPLPGGCGSPGHECLRRQHAIGIGREQEVGPFSAYRLAETQDLTLVVDGCRLCRAIAVGCQIENSRIRAPYEESSQVAASRMIKSDDVRDGIYSDCGARQIQDERRDAVPEYGCHRFTARGRASGRLAEVVYRIDESTQMPSRASAQYVTALARAIELAREDTPEEPERTIADDGAAGVDAEGNGVRSGYW